MHSEYQIQTRTAGRFCCPERYIDLGNARKRGCNPSVQVHPIPIYPRWAINNIPILDTIHLEINQQPIGKPGQIDFEIDNLWSLYYSRFSRSISLFQHFYSIPKYILEISILEVSIQYYKVSTINMKNSSMIFFWFSQFT